MVVAHRGASFGAAEHTLAAYVAAIDSGADALECDVRLTRDGHLVCVHDRTVNRTSDASGIVSELDLQQLAAMDFSSWHGELPGPADRWSTTRRTSSASPRTGSARTAACSPSNACSPWCTTPSGQSGC